MPPFDEATYCKSDMSNNTSARNDESYSWLGFQPIQARLVANTNEDSSRYSPVPRLTFVSNDGREFDEEGVPINNCDDEVSSQHEDNFEFDESALFDDEDCDDYGVRSLRIDNDSDNSQQCCNKGVAVVVGSPTGNNENHQQQQQRRRSNHHHIHHHNCRNHQAASLPVKIVKNHPNSKVSKMDWRAVEKSGKKTVEASSYKSFCGGGDVEIPEKIPPHAHDQMFLWMQELTRRTCNNSLSIFGDLPPPRTRKSASRCLHCSSSSFAPLNHNDADITSTC